MGVGGGERRVDGGRRGGKNKKNKNNELANSASTLPVNIPNPEASSADITSAGITVFLFCDRVR